MLVFKLDRWHFVGAIILCIPLVKNLLFVRNLQTGMYRDFDERNASIAAIKDTLNATTVAFVVTITGCDSHFGREPFRAFDGAAVLAYSIHNNSIHGTNGGTYDYDLYVFHHPNASECALPLKKLGYIVQERDTPVAMSDIRNEAFRAHIQQSGCCGERELIKFEVFTLVQYPVAVLLDADTLVLKPMDRLFDAIIDVEKVPDLDDLMYRGIAIPDRIDLMYTDDNPTGNAWLDMKPTQGGFIVVRPNLTVYNDIVEIVKEGDYRLDGSGWGGITRMFWGGETFQGLVPYYFKILHPNRSLELNYCVWNNNNFGPKQEIAEGNTDQCDPNQENCEDCRLRPIETIGMVHFTSCYKPWWCWVHGDNDFNGQCQSFFHAWYKARSEMETSWGRSGKGNGDFHSDTFFGFCSDFGHGGYQQIDEPNW